MGSIAPGPRPVIAENATCYPEALLARLHPLTIRSMTDLSSTTTRADLLLKMRKLLAALQREAAGRGLAEVVEQTGQTDALIADRLRRETN